MDPGCLQSKTDASGTVPKGAAVITFSILKKERYYYQIDEHDRLGLLVQLVPQVAGEGDRVGLQVAHEDGLRLLLAAVGQRGQRHGQSRRQGGNSLGAA